MRVALPRPAVPRRGPQEILLEVREDHIPRRHGLGPRRAVLREVRQLLQRLLCAKPEQLLAAAAGGPLSLS